MLKVIVVLKGGVAFQKCLPIFEQKAVLWYINQDEAVKLASKQTIEVYYTKQWPLMSPNGFGIAKNKADFK